jgi:Mrp family chromosome partitioning ATPase
LAQAADARVLVIDADLRSGNLAKRLGLEEPAGPGLVEAILDPMLSLDVVVRRRAPFNLSVLPAGRLPAAPYELLKSPRVGELLAEARRQYDYVILDTPPLVSVPDGRVIGKWVDGFLLAVAAHKTPRKLLTEALNVMDPATVVGLIFNGDDRPLSGYPDFYLRTRNGTGRGWPARVVKRMSDSLPSRLGRRRRDPSSDV